jgi:hypothetical protein
MRRSRRRRRWLPAMRNRHKWFGHWQAESSWGYVQYHLLQNGDEKNGRTVFRQIETSKALKLKPHLTISHSDTF